MDQPLISRFFSCFLQKSTYEQRSSVVRGISGTDSSARSIEVPIVWSTNASDILEQKFARKRGVPSVGAESSLDQIVHRMAGCWSYWGVSSGLLTDEEAAALYDDSRLLIEHQFFAPNSPQWFNTGLHWAYGISSPSSGHWYVSDSGDLVESHSSYVRPQPHACFIQSVSDDLVSPGGIMDLWVREARLFKYGSGTGSNFSAIRGKGESLSGGGQSSGLMSWLRIGDRSAGGIKSGGTTRRAAKMVVLDMDHPDIEDFISWKSTEETKVASLVAGSRLIASAVKNIQKAARSGPSFDSNISLQKAVREARKSGVPEQVVSRALSEISQGVFSDPTELSFDWQGEAYDTVSGQQSNNSVSVPDVFMELLDAKDDSWELRHRTGPSTRKVSARGLWGQVALSAWRCADPGVQFVDTMNDWNTVANSGAIRATNPCSEYVFLDDTACNLASLNLTRFLSGSTFDIEPFCKAVVLATTILDISVSMAQLPSKEIAKGTFDYRTLGLGFANLGALLMRMGIPYDSREGRRIAAGIASLMTATAYAHSGRMARKLSPFPKWRENTESMAKVITNHHRMAHGLAPQDVRNFPPLLDLSVSDRATPILAAAAKAWDEALSFKDSGYRNAQVTCIAPTGTIGIVMDCDTTGLEPDFALVKHKTLAGGGFMKIVNQSVLQALISLGYSSASADRIIQWVVGSGRISDSWENRLFSRGLSADAIGRIGSAVRRSVHLSSAFLPDVIGRSELQALGIDPSSDIPGQLGFTPEEFEAESLEVCGRQTIEGAPDLLPEHLPVFDCANRCGLGQRFISADGHLKMLAAIQPFISGASSKTINLPSGATAAQVREVYTKAWTLGIKAVAIYVDGSKLSQPLTAMASRRLFGDDFDHEEASPSVVAEKVVEKIVERTVIRQISERKKLPARRQGYTQRVLIGGHKVFLRTGEYPDGRLGEIFVDLHREGTAFKGLMSAFSVAVSIGLQYGVPLERFVDLFTYTKFEPNGVVMDDDRIAMCSSLIDWVFRHLAVNYLGRSDLGSPLPDGALDQTDLGVYESEPGTAHDLERDIRSVTPSSDVRTPSTYATFAGEFCSACGQSSLVWTGTCRKCQNPACMSDASASCG